MSGTVKENLQAAPVIDEDILTMAMWGQFRGTIVLRSFASMFYSAVGQVVRLFDEQHIEAAILGI